MGKTEQTMKFEYELGKKTLAEIICEIQADMLRELERTQKDLPEGKVADVKINCTIGESKIPKPPL